MYQFTLLIGLLNCVSLQPKELYSLVKFVDSYEIKYKRTKEKWLFTFYSYRTFQKDERDFNEGKKYFIHNNKFCEIAATLNVKGIRMDFGGETCVKVEKPWKMLTK